MLECRCGSRPLIIPDTSVALCNQHTAAHLLRPAACCHLTALPPPLPPPLPTSTTPCVRFLFELGYLGSSFLSSPSSLKLIFIGCLFVKSVFRNSQCGVPSPVTRLNLPFQMKAVPERDGVVWPERRSACLQTAGMWDVWSGGQEARKECQLCPCLSRAGSPFSSR